MRWRRFELVERVLRSRLRRNAGKVTTAHGPESRTHVCCRGLLVGARNLLHRSQNILILPYSIVFISQPRHVPLSSNYLHKTAIADKFFFWSAWDGTSNRILVEERSQSHYALVDYINSVLSCLLSNAIADFAVPQYLETQVGRPK
jgi:hypothetical protein